MLRFVSSLLASFTLVLSTLPAHAEDPPAAGAAPALRPESAQPPAGAFGLPVQREPRSRAAMTGGIILLSSGITALVVGTQLTVAAEDCRNSDFFLGTGTPPGLENDCTDKGGEIAGIATLI